MRAGGMARGRRDCDRCGARERRGSAQTTRRGRARPPRVRRRPRSRSTAIAVPAGAEAMKIDGEISRRGLGARRSRHGIHPARSQGRRRRRRTPTEVRVVYDQAALYVAVRALDPEPDKIVGMLTRRDDGSPSDWVRVMIDSYQRQADGVRVRRQRRRRQAGPLLVRRHEQRSELGRRVGRRRGTKARRAGARSSRFRSRSCASIPRRATAFGFAVMRTVAHAERDVHVAAARAERERLRVVVRRAERARVFRQRRRGSSSRRTRSPR